MQCTGTRAGRKPVAVPVAVPVPVPVLGLASSRTFLEGQYNPRTFFGH